MKSISAGLATNNYIGSRNVKNLFKDTSFDVRVKNINVGGCIHGCSGFILNKVTGKFCYITTEPFFDGGRGSGLYNNQNNAIMMRTAKDDKDFVGGKNNWIRVYQIVQTAKLLTSEEYSE